MAIVGAKKTIRDLIFKDKRHKDFQESEKINFANKGIVKLILLYTISSIFSVAQRDWQYKRNIEKLVNANLLENSCLLCSEHKPHFCHRRLVVEYLNKNSDLKLEVKHLY